MAQDLFQMYAASGPAPTPHPDTVAADRPAGRRTPTPRHARAARAGKECGTKLNIKTYKTSPLDDEIYCHKCVPMARPTVTSESVENQRVKNRPKVSLVNDQVRGELAGQKSMETTDSVAIGGRINAPRQGVINEQIRGALAGQKPQEDLESIAIASRVHAPKVGVINEQIRGATAGQKPELGPDALSIASRVNAPKVGLVNDQVRLDERRNRDVKADAVATTPALPVNDPDKFLIDERLKREGKPTVAEAEGGYARLSHVKPAEGAEYAKPIKKKKKDEPLQPTLTEEQIYRMSPEEAARRAQEALELMSAKEAAIAAQRAASVAAYTEQLRREGRIGDVEPPPLPTSSRPPAAPTEDTYVNPDDAVVQAEPLYEDVRLGAEDEQKDLYMPLI